MHVNLFGIGVGDAVREGAHRIVGRAWGSADQGQTCLPGSSQKTQLQLGTFPKDFDQKGFDWSPPPKYRAISLKDLCASLINKLSTCCLFWELDVV